MTDITKPVTPARVFLSDDVLQILYRLLAALLICAVLAIFDRLVRKPRQYPERSAASEPLVLHRVRPDPRRADGRARSFRWR